LTKNISGDTKYKFCFKAQNFSLLLIESGILKQIYVY